MKRIFLYAISFLAVSSAVAFFWLSRVITVGYVYSFFLGWGLALGGAVLLYRAGKIIDYNNPSEVEQVRESLKKMTLAAAIRQQRDRLIKNRLYTPQDLQAKFQQQVACSDVYADIKSLLQICDYLQAWIQKYDKWGIYDIKDVCACVREWNLIDHLRKKKEKHALFAFVDNEEKYPVRSLRKWQLLSGEELECILRTRAIHARFEKEYKNTRTHVDKQSIPKRGFPETDQALEKEYRRNLEALKDAFSREFIEIASKTASV
ncbi:MAG: hypothetical protein AAGI90_05130 [Chlamydiota bacterium]